jgi:hypothetical protein
MRHFGKRRLMSSENSSPAGPAPITLICIASDYAAI